MSDLRSPLAKARDEWMESPEGQSAKDPTFLFKRSDAQYLRNRLENAFIAGANWAARHLAQSGREEAK